ncbi:MAG: D-glycero-beta-D-manno-heptose 1,7-bisphosphate 7-phosphatase [Sedimenticola sp.]
MKLIILDRDGVINVDSDEYIKHPDEWQPIPGSLEAIAALNHANYHVVVASNQSGIARGLFDIDTLNTIHQKMYDQLEQVGGHIDALFFCPHTPSDGCNCRKPKPGMLLEIGERLGCDLRDVYVIGDSLRDLQSAEAVGAKAILLRTGKGAVTEQLHAFNSKLPVFDNLEVAISSLIRLPDELDLSDDTA